MSIPRPIWRRDAWRAGALLLLVAILWHAPLFWDATSRPRPNTTLPKNRSEEVYMVMEPLSTKSSRTLVAWDDPTIFLLPSDQGFSSTLRTRLPKTRSPSEEATPPVLIQPFAPQRWSEDENDAMPPFLSESANMDSTLTPGLPTERGTDEPDAQGSAWRAFGGIADRTPSATSALPVIRSTEPVRPTLLRVGVDTLGDAAFVMLEKSSGLDKADEAAIRFVKGIHFSTMDSTNQSQIAWGFMKILWRAERPRHTEPAT